MTEQFSHHESGQEVIHLEAWLDEWIASGGELHEIVEAFDEGLLTIESLKQLDEIAAEYEAMVREEEAELLKDFRNFVQDQPSENAGWVEESMHVRLNPEQAPGWTSYQDMLADFGPEAPRRVIEVEDLPEELWARCTPELQKYLRENIQSIVLTDFARDESVGETDGFAYNGFSYGKGLIAINMDGKSHESPDTFLATLLHEAAHEAEGHSEHDHSGEPQLKVELEAYELEHQLVSKLINPPQKELERIQEAIDRGAFIKEYLLPEHPRLAAVHPGRPVYAHFLSEHEIPVDQLERTLRPIRHSLSPEEQRPYDEFMLATAYVKDYEKPNGPFRMWDASNQLYAAYLLTKDTSFLQAAEQAAGLYSLNPIADKWTKDRLGATGNPDIFEGLSYLSRVPTSQLPGQEDHFPKNLPSSSESLKDVDSIEDLFDLPEDHPLIESLDLFFYALPEGSPRLECSKYSDLAAYVTAYRALKNPNALWDRTLMIDHHLSSTTGSTDYESFALSVHALDLQYERGYSVEGEYEKFPVGLQHMPEFNRYYEKIDAAGTDYIPTAIPEGILDTFQLLKGE